MTKQTVFALSLRAARMRSHMTQQQVADRLGVTQQTYRSYERGLCEPQLRTFFALCGILSADPVALYYGRQVDISPDRMILDKIADLIDGRRFPDARKHPLFDYTFTARNRSGRAKKEGKAA